MPEAKARIHTLLLVREEQRPDRIILWDCQDITVGRSPENDLAVPQPEISRRHASFGRQAGAWIVENLSASNGTYVNGAEVRIHRLTNKDKVRVGELEIQFLQTRKNPATLGVKLEHASALKEIATTANPSATATMLALIDSVDGEDDSAESFHVEPAGEFEYQLHGLEAPPKTKSSGSVSLHLEIEGLSADLQRVLQSVQGKETLLPSLKIRVKPDDLG